MTDRLEDVLDLPPEPQQVDIGTVGWDDRDDYLLKGETTDDGHDLVRVTLFRGRDARKRPKKGVALGQKILCTIADHVGLPPKGARVMIAIPQGMESSPGAAMIIGTCSAGPGRFDNLQSNAKTLNSPLGIARVVVKDDGTITIRTTHNNEQVGYDVYQRTAPDSWKFVAPWGTMTSNAMGWAWTAAGGATMNMGAMALPAPFDALASWFRVQAGVVTFKCSTARFGIGPADKLTKSTPLMVALGAIQTAMVSLNSAIAAGLVATGAPGSVAAGAGYTTAATPIMGTLGTALTDAADAIQAVVASE